MRTSTVLITLTVWLAVATAAVAAGFLTRVPVPPPAIVLLLAAVTVLVGVLQPGARAWIDTVDWHYFLFPHLVRFVGIAFLVLVSRGVLAREFAPIGWGDTIAAIGAVVLLLSRPSLSTPAGWWSVFAWNCFGLADMILLIVTGIRLGSAAPEQFALFVKLPFGLLPTFFVPLIIATHVFLFRRLFARRAAAS